MATIRLTSAAQKTTKEQITESLVNGTSKILGGIHLVSTIIADSALNTEVSLKTKYLHQDAKTVAHNRLLVTNDFQSKLKQRTSLSYIISDDINEEGYEEVQPAR